jgi:hypothetical protein
VTGIQWGVRAAVLAILGACSFSARSAATGDAPREGVAFFDAPSPLDAAPGDWWDPTYRWRIPLTIQTTAALADGYQVGLALDLDAAPCNGPRDAIRIVRVSGATATERPRVIDEVGTTEWTWFALGGALPANATSTEYWLYCANPSPSPAPKDPATVFDFYDGFTGALDTSVWTSLNAVAVTGGQLVCGGSGVRDNGIVTKTKMFPAKSAVDFVATASSTTASDWWAGFQNGTADVAPWLHWYTKNQNAACPDFLGVSTDQPWYGTDVPLDTAPHQYSVENYGTKSMYRLADVPVQSHIYAPMSPPPAMVNVRLWDGSDMTQVSYDWVRVRKAVDPPPTVTAGTPQTY